ncbi:FAD-dependent monooxygenase [Saccharothrix syringae]|uniref:FAD-binding monooxygenase n=1 Tax=Saccharothrix syringae TaxID=103733 RepID=A0A5Q0H5F6_SACSY|nr:FAD-dependent monooxygenase [Saccharothrix syringae]QFZ21426.1 FAD-binding monooxygenase [Saccharothrix syringae]
MTRTRVLVVGAGPVGLLLAGELARCGVGAVVVDRLASPMTESRASQLNSRTAELFAERGLTDLLEAARPEPSGHFGGLRLSVSDVDSPWAGYRKVPQHRTEAALAGWAVGLGARLLRGHELCELSDEGDRVVCGLGAADGPVRVVADYVVGCDGADSTVRRLAGFGHEGAAATRELLRADVAGIDVPDRRFERFPRGLAIAATANGVTRVMVHAFGRAPRERSGPPSFDEVVANWAEVTGEDISAGRPLWVDAFDNRHGHVTGYRRGRVLLAGDAAHWHMPIGGQALNLGLQDAVNLGWKLAAEVRGWAPPGLLDSYSEERHAEGGRVLANVLTQEQLLLGGPEAEALRTTFRELMGLDDVRRHLAGVLSGLDVAYGG